MAAANASAHTLAPRSIKNLQEQIGLLDKEYDKCNLIWAQGEIDKFGEQLLTSKNVVYSDSIQWSNLFRFQYCDLLSYTQLSCKKIDMYLRFYKSAEQGMRDSTLVFRT